MTEVDILKRQLTVAIECLDVYRTLVIEDTRFKTGNVFRLGKHAEQTLELLAAIRRKVKVMKTVRCKMTCEYVKESKEGLEVEFKPVYDDNKESEKGIFYIYTPYGNLTLGIVNPAIKFDPGKEYFIDIVAT